MATNAVDAKTAALSQMTEAYEQHAEAEQMFRGHQRFEDATIEHGACVLLLRAMAIEESDPAPETTP